MSKYDKKSLWDKSKNYETNSHNFDFLCHDYDILWWKCAHVLFGHQRHQVYWHKAHLDAQRDQGCKITVILYLGEGILCQKDVSTFNRV